MPGHEYQLLINARAYLITLAVITIGLIVIHCGLNYYTHQVEEIPWLIVQLFHLDEENNIPTWFSGFLLLNNAFILYLIAGNSPGDYPGHWLVLAVGFLILSIDEVAGLHESLNTAIEINWAIPGGILVALIGLAFIPFLLSLPRRLAMLFILSGMLYVSGAIGAELVSEDMDEDSMAYGFAVAVEEGFEMIGALLFLVVNLRQMKDESQLRIKVKSQ